MIIAFAWWNIFNWRLKSLRQCLNWTKKDYWVSLTLTNQLPNIMDFRSCCISLIWSIYNLVGRWIHLNIIFNFVNLFYLNKCTSSSVITPREPRGIEMGPRASSAWRGVRRLCGMYKCTTNPSCGWDVNKTEVPCWEIATLSARQRTQCNIMLMMSGP